MRPDLFTALVVGVAAYRLAVLLAGDLITRPVRYPLIRWLRRRGMPGAWAENLLTCYRCLTVWTTAALVVALAHTDGRHPPIGVIAVEAAAAAGVAALAARWAQDPVDTPTRD